MSRSSYHKANFGKSREENMKSDNEKLKSKCETKSAAPHPRRDPFFIFMAIVSFFLMIVEVVLNWDETSWAAAACHGFVFLVLLSVGVKFLDYGIGSESAEKN